MRATPDPAGHDPDDASERITTCVAHNPTRCIMAVAATPRRQSTMDNGNADTFAATLNVSRIGGLRKDPGRATTRRIGVAACVYCFRRTGGSGDVDHWRYGSSSRTMIAQFPSQGTRVAADRAPVVLEGYACTNLSAVVPAEEPLETGDERVCITEGGRMWTVVARHAG
jgi:hypothetical protein